MPSANKYRAGLQHLNLYVFCFGILLATTCMRLDHILGMPWIKTLLHAYFVAVLVVGCLTLAVLRLKHFIAASLFIGLLLWQSFAYLYQPSLNFDVPIQDWLLADTVSSNYSFDQVCLYLRNLSIFIFPVLALNSSQAVSERKKQLVPLIFIGLGLFLNSVVSMMQGFFGLEILAQGSGTAVGSSRAAGLLEDSGASTVYFAMMVSGMFAALLISKQSYRKSLIIALALLMVTAAGAQTSGRIFFVASILPIIILSALGIVRSFKRQNLKAALYAAGAVGSLLTVFYYLLQWKMRDSTLGDFIQSSFSSLDGQKLDRMITALDPVRSIHWRVMAKTFLENPIFGTGLGSFYSNLQEHAAWASQWGGRLLVDPPGSFYLMLLSELGLLGILIIVALLWTLYTRSKYFISHSIDLRSAFCFGCFLSLGFSFLIGIHFLFLSISSLIGLAFFGKFASNKESLSLLGTGVTHRLRPIQYGFVACATLSIAAAYVLAPRPPAFRWLARGKPQVPVSLGIPIQAPGSGNWFPSGAEVLLPTPRFQFFVELPPSSYPLQVWVKIRDEAGKEVAHGHHRIESYTHLRPGRLLSFDLPQHLTEECFRQISPSNFCSVSIATTPPWQFGDYKLGFFVSTKHLDPPLISQANEKDQSKQ